MMKMTERVSGFLMAVLLTLSMHAAAAPQTAGTDFNHATTGFALTGGHMTAACETCHVGGVFKGTPRNCDGCHAVGKRVVATPKSSSHIVTDAPCESCHFNASTWLGARYNHGTAQPGSCQTCHNGRLSMSKPASHNIGSKATNSCDQCHRTYAWLPASWNHVGTVPGTCKNAGCHDSSNLYNTTAQIRTTGKTHNNFVDTSTRSCDACHTVFRWTPAMHIPVSGTCSSCHNGSTAEGKHTGHIATVDECSQCHTSTVTWLGALGAKPATHILYNAGVSCTACHTGGAVVTGATLHAYVSGVCKNCHDSGSGVTTILGVTGRKKLGSHEGSSTSQDCITCHTVRFTSWNKP